MNETTYFDIDGNERSLNWMTRNEPEWAANVIRTVKAKNTDLKELISILVELMERSDMEEFGEECQPVKSGEWFLAIEKAKAAIGQPTDKEKRMIPSKAENPDGLHTSYKVTKADGSPVDSGSEYLVLRLDYGGKNLEHIAASRKAATTYADEIEQHMPQLAAYLRDRYSLF